MLNADQIKQLKAQGYLIVEDVVSQTLLTVIKAEYTAKMDALYAHWQSLGISLPHAGITEATPFHFGPACA